MLCIIQAVLLIVALRNEKGSYNCIIALNALLAIVALRNEKGSYNTDSMSKNC